MEGRAEGFWNRPAGTRLGGRPGCLSSRQGRRAGAGPLGSPRNSAAGVWCFLRDAV